MNILASDGIVVAGKCIPSNDTLSAAVGTPLADFIGAFWGLSPWFIGGVVVVLAILAIINAMNDKAPKFIKGIAIAVGVAVGIWFILMLYFVVTGNLPDVEACPF